MLINVSNLETEYEDVHVSTNFYDMQNFDKSVCLIMSKLLSDLSHTVSDYPDSFESLEDWIYSIREASDSLYQYYRISDTNDEITELYLVQDAKDAFMFISDYLQDLWVM